MRTRKGLQESAVPSLEPLEPRLLLDSVPYDLTVEVGSGWPEGWIPGDKLRIPVIVTNNGPEPARHK